MIKKTIIALLLCGLLPCLLVKADEAGTAGEITGRYLSSAAYVEAVSKNCAAFSKNKVTLDAAYATAMTRLPKKYAKLMYSEMPKSDFASLTGDYGAHSQQALSVYPQLNSDTRCGLLMGIALGIHATHRDNFLNAFPSSK